MCLFFFFVCPIVAVSSSLLENHRYLYSEEVTEPTNAGVWGEVVPQCYRPVTFMSGDRCATAGIWGGRAWCPQGPLLNLKIGPLASQGLRVAREPGLVLVVWPACGLKRQPHQLPRTSCNTRCPPPVPQFPPCQQEVVKLRQAFPAGGPLVHMLLVKENSVAAAATPKAPALMELSFP